MDILWLFVFFNFDLVGMGDETGVVFAELAMEEFVDLFDQAMHLLVAVETAVDLKAEFEAMNTNNKGYSGGEGRVSGSAPG